MASYEWRDGKTQKYVIRFVVMWLHSMRIRTQPECISAGEQVINGQISINVHRTHTHMHTHFWDAWAINRHKNTHSHALFIERHNTNRICQTRKIHQSATHLYNHHSISRHQFIAFAFIAERNQRNWRQPQQKEMDGFLCVFCVTY